MVYDVSAIEKVMIIPHVIKHAAVTPDGKKIAICSIDNYIYLWDVKSGKQVGKHKQIRYYDISHIDLSPDGKTVLLSHNSQGKVILYYPGTGRLRELELEYCPDRISSAIFSPSGEEILTGVGNTSACIWDVASGLCTRRPFMWDSPDIISTAFSPDWEYIATAAEDETIRIWDLRTYTPLDESIEGYDESFNYLTFSPDGTRLAAAGMTSRFVRIWDIESQELVGQPLAWHPQEVTCIAFSHDGKTIVTGCRDWNLRLWDAETGRPIGRPLTGITLPNHSIAFTPDDKRIISVAPCNPIRIWDVSEWTRQ